METDKHGKKHYNVAKRVFGSLIRRFLKSLQIPDRDFASVSWKHLDTLSVKMVRYLKKRCCKALKLNSVPPQKWLLAASLSFWGGWNELVRAQSVGPDNSEACSRDSWLKRDLVSQVSHQRRHDSRYLLPPFPRAGHDDRRQSMEQWLMGPGAVCAVGGDSREVKWCWAAGEVRVAGQKQRWRLLKKYIRKIK